MKQKIILTGEVQRGHAISIIRDLPLEPISEVVIREHKTTRNLEQNSKMWAMLADVSAQVVWYGQKLTSEEWKDVFTASLKQQKVVPGIDGGFVVIGARTSKMSIAEMSELIEFAMAFGCQHNVKWKAPAIRLPNPEDEI
jgi:hypothetical protein